MNLIESFRHRLFEITALKYVGVNNQRILNLLNLNIKPSVFRVYLVREKNEISEIEALNNELFNELLNDFKKHRNAENILNKINQIHSSNPSLANQTILKEKLKETSLIDDNIDENLNDDNPEDGSLYNEKNINAKRNKLEEISKKGVDLQSLILKERIKSKKQ